MLHYIPADTVHAGRVFRDTADLRADASLLLTSLREAKTHLSSLLSLREEMETRTEEIETAFLDAVEESENRISELSREVSAAIEEIRDALWLFGEGGRGA
jgi:chromosome segregation ATPase